MAPLSHFTIGRSALRAFRVAMNNAGYNAANVHTPGFSRRRVDLAPMPPLATGTGISSVGVEVSRLERVRDPFLDFSFRRETARHGADVARSRALVALEPILGEVDSAEIRRSLSDLFDAIENLIVQPDALGIRENVVDRAQRFASTVRRAAGALDEARRNADLDIEQGVERMNEIMERLQTINREIVGLEAVGQQATDIRDERDRLLDELADLIGVRVVEADDGQVSVFLEGSGDASLAGVSQRTLAVERGADGLLRIVVDRAGEKVDLTDSLRGGRIGGLLAARDDDIAGYQEQLDRFAAAAIEQFNAIHRAGFDLDGNPGQALFEPDPPGTSASALISVNPAIVADERLLAAASAPGEPGDNGNLRALLELRERAITVLDERTLIGFAADLVADVGRDVAGSLSAQQASELIVDSLDAQRQRVSGVSLDEEAADLARFQQAFEAAARYMAVLDRVTQTAINLLGN